MPRTHTGGVALPVIFGIGAFTGILTYFLFSQAAPGHSIFTPSMFFQPLPPPLTLPSKTLPETSSTKGGENTGTSTTAINNSENQANNDTSQIPANAVTIDILEGAAVQGNPTYQPDDAKAGIDSTVVWKNDDSVPHTATSGAGPDDSNAGKQFNSGLLDPGADYSIATNKIGSGEHPYFCQVHPYMKGKITIS